jgi:hypothetical protein
MKAFVMYNLLDDPYSTSQSISQFLKTYLEDIHVDIQP